LASPFLGVPRGGRPDMVGGQVASPCGKSSSIMHQSGGGGAKEDVSGEENGKRGSRWPAGHPFWPTDQALASTLPELSPSPSSCSPHVQTTDQKLQKQCNFPSFFSKVPFIYLFLKFLMQ
jgi:hypothetical protein